MGNTKIYSFEVHCSGVVLASQRYHRIVIPFQIFQKGLDTLNLESVNENVTLNPSKVTDIL